MTETQIKRMQYLECQIRSIEQQLLCAGALISSESIDGASVSYGRQEALEILRMLQEELRTLLDLNTRTVNAARAFSYR
jgi:hypothetical protein